MSYPKHNGTCHVCGIAVTGKKVYCHPCDLARSAAQKREQRTRQRAIAPPVHCRYCSVEIPRPKRGRQLICAACKPRARAEIQRKKDATWRAKRDAKEAARAAKLVVKRAPRIPKPKSVKALPKPKPYVPPKLPPVVKQPIPRPVAALPFVTGDEATAAARFAEVIDRLSRWGFATSSREGLVD